MKRYYSQLRQKGMTAIEAYAGALFARQYERHTSQPAPESYMTSCFHAVRQAAITPKTLRSMLEIARNLA